MCTTSFYPGRLTQMIYSTFITSTFTAYLGTQGAKKIDAIKQFDKIAFNKPIGVLALCVTGVSNVLLLILLLHCVYSLSTTQHQTLW